MKKLIFVFSLFLVSNVASAVTFSVGPRAGVNSNQLSQARVFELRDYLLAIYSEDAESARRVYEATINAPSTPAEDLDADLLQQRYERAWNAYMTAVDEAANRAVRDTLRNCNLLCYVTKDGVRYE